jgi:hypothetical protein
MRATIERGPKAAHIGESAAADPVRRFDQRETPPGCGNTARRGNACGAGADDHHIDFA